MTKSMHEKPTADTTLSRESMKNTRLTSYSIEKAWMLPSKIRNDYNSHSCHFNIILKVLDKIISQERKEVKGIQIEQEEVKYLFSQIRSCI